MRAQIMENTMMKMAGNDYPDDFFFFFLLDFYEIMIICNDGLIHKLILQALPAFCNNSLHCFTTNEHSC